MANTGKSEAMDTRRPLPECASLAIGSLPYTDVSEAIDRMIEFNSICPAWPQLPAIDYREGMYIQFAECMPAAIVDENRRRVWFDVERAPEEMASFYERHFAREPGLCRISPDHARGFEPFLERMPTPGALFIKGQVTGPVTFGFTVTDAENKPVIYHEDLFAAIVTALALKGGWQAGRFREQAPDLTPVIFFDEPFLTQVGSAIISLPAEKVTASLRECYEPVTAVGGLTGTHVCGGTDWGLLASTGVDIIHFDAVDHFQELLIYGQELAQFLERGGMLAWGIIPTDERSLEMGQGDAVNDLIAGAERVARLAPHGIDVQEVLRRSFVSQSCGLGSRSAEIAGRCLSLAAEVADVLHSQIC